MNGAALSDYSLERIYAVDVAIESLSAQSQALNQIAQRLGDEFNQSIEFILSCKGHTIIPGMGKSDLIGKKMAATLASTGTPASSFIRLRPTMGIWE